MIVCHLNVSWTSLLVLTLVILFAMSSDAGDKYVSVDFEVFGNVQGVCFRMYTEAEAEKLGVTGWVKNTRQGTVVGQVQGHPEKVKEIWRQCFSVGVMEQSRKAGHSHSASVNMETHSSL
uniref:Acylphosphatase n=1 Tax=Cyprinus carpio carpio TaxID=630221 RepID=A0A9J8BPJ3_CYPCA